MTNKTLRILSRLFFLQQKYRYLSERGKDFPKKNGTIPNNRLPLPALSPFPPAPADGNGPLLLTKNEKKHHEQAPFARPTAAPARRPAPASGILPPHRFVRRPHPALRHGHLPGQAGTDVVRHPRRHQPLRRHPGHSLQRLESMAAGSTSTPRAGFMWATRGG